MRNTLNETACAALLENVNWINATALLKLAILLSIDVLVIVGNCLVIAAVLCSSKLKLAATNIFIASLAVADLMVGVVVLPFSSVWEVFKVWTFGWIWCRIWLAVDVWMCTASILNLCAISLDRYVAVTRPITYPSIMSKSRAKMLVAGLWVLSFVICFPPLVGWEDSKSAKSESNASLLEDNPDCPWKCELINESGYVVYSALGSFYIPMFVMLFFYWRIYKAAVRTTQAINQGFKITGPSGNRFEHQRLTLRIHRGRGSSTKASYGSPNGSSYTATTNSSASPSPRRSHDRKHERVKISVSYPSNENMSSASSSPQLLTVTPTSPSTSHPSYVVHYSVNGKDLSNTVPCLTQNTENDNYLKVNRCIGKLNSKRRSNSVDSGQRARSASPCRSDETENSGKSKLTTRRMGKRNIKAQVKRFRMETKAAKTLGIIVGGFIVCWLPFFSMYLVRAFCKDCINPLVFSILFWLGYCNSAINPLIYALFSKDFRFAFKKIICRCFCTDNGSRGSRRGSEGSQLQGRHNRSPSYNMQPHSLGEESDTKDNSDSR
ncbi:octopamine receptor Oamb [Anthonomus grandis grandis]|uniref:octopamine receptor Oamb n=1 Tax=Anthonomus grandis grandis TaxID=2921223 RepID=UPI0021661C86|nr:octopamine receptor Oamb [Anthonomus grandis grandis]